MSKYGDYQVSLYTGLPQVSIPIYTIQTGDLSTQIQLSYHGGGVKVDDVESWAGVNWSLNAGGAITRTVVGFEDERSPGGFLYRNQHNLPVPTTFQLGNADDYIFMKQVQSRLIDTEPDIFFFNFAGFSGKFFFDETGAFHAIPANALKLLKCPVNNTTNPPTDKFWLIADLEGNTYQFGANDQKGIEKTVTFRDAPSAADQKITAWYLTKIISADKSDTVDFDYITKNESYTLPFQQSYRHLTNQITEPLRGDIRANTLLYDGTRPQSAVANTFMASGTSQLREIRWRDGKAVFDAGISRTDFTGKVLTAITIYTASGARVKQFSLKHTFVKQRYYLDTLIEGGSDQSRLLKHNFEYLSREALPIRCTNGVNSSDAQDHWGYYNGASANTSALPNQQYVPSSFTNSREVNATFAKYGSLRRIYYPTGGFTDFDFESNQFDPSSFPPGEPPAPVIVTKIANLRASNPQTSLPRVATFSIPFNQNNAVIAIQYRNYGKPPEAHVGWLPLVKIEKLINGSYTQVNYWDAFVNFPVGNVPPPNSNNLIDYNITTSVSLTSGSYRISTDLVCGSPNCGTPTYYPSVDVQFTYYDNYTPPASEPNTIAGGLRIKTISNYAYGTVLSSRKQYNYSPGKMLFYPRYINQYTEDYTELLECFGTPQCNFCIPLEAKFKEINSTSQTILGFTQGSAVGYGSVEELEVDATGAANGKTVYEYSFVNDVVNELQMSGAWSGSGISIINASMPSDSYEYKRGLLVSQKTYGVDGSGNFYLLRSLDNTYQFNDNDPTRRFKKMKGLRVKTMRLVTSYKCGTPYNGYILGPSSQLEIDFGYTFYNLVTSWVQNQTTVETTYSPYGGTPLVKSTTFGYANSSHLQPTSIATINSKGDEIKTVNKYAHDFAGTSVYDAMIARNQISPIVEQIVYRNTTDELSRKKVNYAFWHGTSFIAPATEFTSLWGAALFKTMNYDSYDSKGNLIQYTPSDGITTSLVYGYGYSKLVAKVAGADQTAVALKLNVATIQSLTGAPLRTELNKLRTISNAQTESFTYKPLTGIDSDTDVNARSTFYNYDVLGRLHAVKDHNLNVLKTFEYQYQISFNQ